MFWKIYFWIITSLETLSLTSEGFVSYWAIPDIIISTFAFTGLLSYAYKKRIFGAKFWKLYFFTYLIWDLIYSFIISSSASDDLFDITVLIAFIIICPLYVALYRYAFIFFEGKGDNHEPVQISNEDFINVQYPSITRRYFASFIDGLLIFVVFLMIAYILKQSSGIVNVVKVGLILSMFFIYEPFCTSKLCTLGQKIMGIRVRSVGTYERISIISAYMRIIVKILLGIISFFTIPFTRGKRGIHDFAANSIVIYINEEEQR